MFSFIYVRYSADEYAITVDLERGQLVERGHVSDLVVGERFPHSVFEPTPVRDLR
ncbi:MAG: hypothetical protein ACRDFS_02525 [Chloroflexota bacterium]